MDQSLELSFKVSYFLLSFGFNPYFSGSVTGTIPVPSSAWPKPCFNPYFSGSVTGTFQKGQPVRVEDEFQSLF